MVRAFALESRTAFLAEERSKSYEWYDARVPQAKIQFWAKSDLRARAWLELERRGA